MNRACNLSIDFEKSRIVVTNALHENFNYKCDFETANID